MSQAIMVPQEPSSDANFKIAKIHDNELSKSESTIVIIPGENDIYDNVTPPNSTADVNENNPCPSIVYDGNKTYTKMRVPNWYVEGYKTIDVGNAICFMNHWVRRSSSNGGGENGETTREDFEPVQGISTCNQGRISRSACQVPPAVLPKPSSVEPNCSCCINSKYHEIAGCQTLRSSCNQTSKGPSTVQAPREILTKAQHHYNCVPKTDCVCGQINETLSTRSENGTDIKQDTNENAPEDNNTQLVRKQLKTKKDCKTKRSSKSAVNSKELKFPSAGKNHNISENSKTSKQSKPKSSKTKESPTNSNSMVTQCSQTSLDADPNELYHQQCHDSNQSFIAEITAYLGNSSIKKRCKPSVVEHLLGNLFGSQLSDIDGIEIRKIRKDESMCTMHKDQSTVTVESCCCQTELQDCPNNVDEFCNENKEITQKTNLAYDKEVPAFQNNATKTAHQDETDDSRAQVYCSRSFVMQRPQQCLYTSGQFRKPLKCNVYPLHGKCVNCGRKKISQNLESNTTLRSFMQNIPPAAHTISGRYTNGKQNNQ